MERDIIMVESHQENNPIIAPKSIGSIVKIDSISIDLDPVKDKRNVGNCEHFSIRGYVSEIRKKNWKTCWPFDLDEDHNKSNEQKTILPSLHVPKFRRWCCENCVQKVGVKGAVNDYGSKFNSFIESKSYSTSLLGDADIFQSDNQQSLKLNVAEGINIDAYASTEENCNMQRSLFCEKREEKAKVQPSTLEGYKNSLKDDERHEIPALTTIPAEISSNRMPGKHKSDTDTEKLEWDRCFKVCKQNCRNREVTDTFVEAENQMCINRKSITTCQTKKQGFQNEESKKLKITYGALALATLGNEAVNAFKEHKSGPISEELDECDYVSSESTKILAANSLGQDNQHDKHNAQHSRKTRKVRLISDLLCGNGEVKPDHISTGDTSSCVVNSTSAGIGTVSVLHDQASIPENFTGSLISTTDETKKRKLLHDVEEKSPETSFLNRLSKITSSSKSETEISNAIADSEVNGDKLSGKSATIGMNKKKKNKAVDKGLSSVPREENSSKKVMENIGSSSKSVDRDISLRLEQDVSTSGAVNQSSLLASRKGKKSSYFKKKGRTPQADIGLPSQFLWSCSLSTSLPWQKDISKGDEIPRNNAEIIGIGDVGKYFPTGDSSISFKSPPNASFVKQVHGHSNSNLAEYTIPLLTEKQNCYSQDVGKSTKKTIIDKECSADNRNHGGQVRNKDVANSSKKTTIVNEQWAVNRKPGDQDVANSSKKTTTVKECSAVNRKHVHQVTNEISEKGASDDIPMEIVELMAKNQYERCLDNAGDNARLLEMTKEAIEYSKVYDPKEYGLLEDKNQKQKPQSRNGITTTGKNVVPTTQKAFDYSSHVKRNHNNLSYLGQTQTSTGFSAFNEYHRRPPGGVLFPATGSSCSCAHNCKWNREMVSHGFPRANMLLGACNTCHNVSRSSEEEARIWSSLVPAPLPITYIIPQKGVVQPSNSSIFGCSPSSLHKGNVNKDNNLKYLNLNVTGIEKQNQTVGATTFSKRNADCSITGKHNVIEQHQNSTGSLDLCSNETIPAMHLLSLMNAKMQSSSSLNMGGNSKFLQRTCPDTYSKSVLEPGVYKPSNGKKHSSDYFGRVQPFENSRDFFSVSQPFTPSTSSLQHIKGSERATGFSSQLGATRFPLAAHTKGSLPQNRLECHHANKTYWPRKKSSGTSHCSINRNPADFVLPEVGRYMINGEDLKFGKSINSRRPGQVDHEKRKRQKNVKCTTEKEHT